MKKIFIMTGLVLLSGCKVEKSPLLEYEQIPEGKQLNLEESQIVLLSRLCQAMEENNRIMKEQNDKKNN